MNSTTTIPDSSRKSRSMSTRFSIAMSDIKLAHSVFALPFAILAAFLVAPYKSDAPAHGIHWSKFVGMLVLVVVCMVFARTWAMVVNRVADARLDAENPRTKSRAFASGMLKKRDGLILLVLSAGGFILAACGFGLLYNNWLPAFLSVPMLGWIAFYSFTKRFTWLCHVFLGGALAASPIAAGIAVGPELLFNETGVFAIAAMVLFWVAGFDMIYALQDMEHDQAVGLNSIPARFGWRGAIWISRVFHALSVVCLIVAWMLIERFGAVFVGAVVITALLLVYEHMVLSNRGKAGIPMAFFTLNGIISLLVGLLGIIDILFI